MNRALIYGRMCGNIARLYRVIDGTVVPLSESERKAFRRLAWKAARHEAAGRIWQADYNLTNDRAFPRGDVWGLTGCLSQFDI